MGTLPYNVQLVNIYLSTATFDEIEKDVKVTNHNEEYLGDGITLSRIDPKDRSSF